MASFNLQTLARPNILQLEPYRCARDDYQAGVLLDANENTHGPSVADLDDEEIEQELHRYPDPHQVDLKQQICDFRNSEVKDKSAATLKPDNIFIGVGSDEAIDAVIRILCTPGKDKLLTCPPTYGMYEVSAHINDVAVVKVEMEFREGRFGIRVDEINKTLAADPSIKLAYLCSPGNPTGSLLDREDIIKVIEHPTWNGIVVVDEAYIDFAPIGASMAPLVNKYPNLVVMQTLSKSFGLAGVRCGLSYSSPQFARLMNAMKAPYNISTPTSRLASRALSSEGIKLMRQLVSKIIVQRDRLFEELPKIPGVGKFKGGEHANFVLIEILDVPGGEPSNKIARAAYERLAEHFNIVLRFRGSEPKCLGCLRISIGTEEEITLLLNELKVVLKDIYSKES